MNKHKWHIVLRIGVFVYILLQAYLMLFTSNSCNCKQQFSDLIWFVLMQSMLGVLFLNVRDVVRVIQNVFNAAGYISFFYALIFIVTHNNDIINNKLFTILCLTTYIISFIYILIHNRK